MFSKIPFLLETKNNEVSSQVPRSLTIATREELDALELNIEGKLPTDLKGHVFIVAPVGSVESGGLPSHESDTYLSGDGMIYRFDFGNGRVRLKTRIAKSADYFADWLTKNNKSWNNILVKFANYGVVRFSCLLGSRNLLNTAFLPMKFPGEENYRMLLTYDAGRPHEIDLETLNVITPIGYRKEWTGAFKNIKFPFNSILSTAHPNFDPYTGEMFTVNYGRSLSNFLAAYKDYLFGISKNSILNFIGNILNDTEFEDFVYVVKWDGLNSIKKWKLINYDGSLISIQQSIHQIGISQDYIVLMDTSFVVGIEQVFNKTIPFSELIEKFREQAKTIPSFNSKLYIVPRKDLKDDKEEVIAYKVVIPLESCHFLVDYENPNQKITLHVSHICAWNVAEWLRPQDRSPYLDSLISSDLYGIQQGPMDISRMGRYVIDASNLANNSTKIDFKVITDMNNTWGPGLYAYQERLSSGITPKKFDNIYWVSLGLWRETITDFMYQAYKNSDYPALLPIQKILELANEGIPSSLFRLDTSSNESMAIKDSYQSPPGHIIHSPQFVPRGENNDSINGYIIAVVFTPKRSEIWIFEAWNLKKGPVCKLHHSRLKIGFSLHTAWLPTISSRKASYKVSIKKDYQNAIDDFFNSLSFSWGAEFLKSLQKKHIEELFVKVADFFELQPKEKDLDKF